MKRKIASILLASLCFVTAVSSPLTAFASEIDETVIEEETQAKNSTENETIGVTEWQEIDGSSLPDEDSEDNDCLVTVDVGGDFTVTIPKEITLAGEDGSSSYNVTVKGNIGADETVNVIPDETFDLQSEGKDSVPAQVTQEITAFTYDMVMLTEENVLVGTTTEGLVTASDLSAGKWSGFFWFNINLGDYRFPIIAVDEEGTDLNATGKYIVGEDKQTLLNALVESGEIQSAKEVNALIDVQSDAFTGKAITTFDVSSIAREGDIVSFYHYDETDGWEYIGSAVVSAEGTATGNFNSFSPVAMSVEKFEDHVHSYDIISITKEATCTESGLKTFSCKCGDFYTEELEINPNNHNFLNKVCQSCGKNLDAGLYDENYVMLASWDELTNTYGLDLSKSYAYPDASHANSLLGVLSKNQNLKGATTLIIGDDVTSIGSNNIRNVTSLEYVSVGNSVTEIKAGAFQGCTSLRSVVIPDGVTSIGWNAFASTPWLKEKQNENPLVFVNGKLIDGTTAKGDVIIPNEVSVIGAYAFRWNKDITSVIISDNVTSIEQHAFENCTGLTSVTISDSVTSIGQSAFMQCYFKTIYIPISVSIIDTYNEEISSPSAGGSLFYGGKVENIYCEASEKPDGWEVYWNYSDNRTQIPVTYGITRDVYESTYK